MQQTKKGFTLIELLVVIAIIGILSAIGLVSLNGAREKARDAQRKSDLAQIKTALVLFYDDNSSHYPSIAAADTALSLASGATHDKLVTEYLSRMPVDPQNDGTYFPRYISNDTTGTANNAASTFAIYNNLEAGGATKVYILNEAGFGGEKTRDAQGYTCGNTATFLKVCDPDPTST